MRRTLLCIALFSSCIMTTQAIHWERFLWWLKPKEYALRLDDQLSTGEQEYLEVRDAMAAEQLPKILGTSTPVPLIRTGLCLSGGGIRAVMADAGVLRALDELGVLDTCSHVSGLSGSCYTLIAWLLSQMKPEDFGEKLYHVFTRGMKYPRISDAGNFVRMVGRVVSRTLYPTFAKKFQSIPFSQTKKLADPMLYPYPIWTAISRFKKDAYYWFDISPHQTRLTSPTDEVVSWNSDLFGSVFRNGHLIRKRTPLSLVRLTAISGAFFKERLSVSIPNPLYKLDGHPLAKKHKAILRDAGFDNNIPILPLLTPQRKMDLIIIFDAGKTPIEDLEISLKTLADRYPIARWSKQVEKEALEKPIVYLPAPTPDGVNILYISLAPDKKFIDERDGEPFDPRNFEKNPHCKTTSFKYSEKQARQLSDRMYTTIMHRRSLIRYAFLDTIRKRMPQFSITPQPRQTSPS